MPSSKKRPPQESTQPVPGPPLTEDDLVATLNVLERLVADRSLLTLLGHEHRFRLVEAAAFVARPDPVQRRRLGDVVVGIAGPQVAIFQDAGNASLPRQAGRHH